MSEKTIHQSTASAFLQRDGHFLLIKRSPDRTLAPGVWSGIGGKIEPNEQNDPATACLREIHEETGITRDHIYNLTLRYIIIRRSKDTLRQNYIYFGETDIATLAETNEGTLHWVLAADLQNREFSQTFAAMIHHYITTPQPTNLVVIGVAENRRNTLHMNWSVVEDFE